jgi:hypothetical protein
MADPVVPPETPTSKYGSRKFLISLLMVGITTWMRFRGLLSEESAVTLYMAILGAYQVANVATKMAVNKSTSP